MSRFIFISVAVFLLAPRSSQASRRENDDIGDLEKAVDESAFADISKADGSNAGEQLATEEKSGEDEMEAMRFVDFPCESSETIEEICNERAPDLNKLKDCLDHTQQVVRELGGGHPGAYVDIVLVKILTPKEQEADKAEWEKREEEQKNRKAKSSNTLQEPVYTPRTQESLVYYFWTCSDDPSGLANNFAKFENPLTRQKRGDGERLQVSLCEKRPS